ncbi:MAG TPA: hypothetical protein QGI72_02895 [Poseidonia sp.]|nr:hypothetical protein [Poseidonia sp.]
MGSKAGASGMAFLASSKGIAYLLLKILRSQAIGEARNIPLRRI